MRRFIAFILTVLYISYIAVATYGAEHNDGACVIAYLANNSDADDGAGSCDAHIGSCLVSKGSHHLPGAGNVKVPEIKLTSVAQAEWSSLLITASNICPAGKNNLLPSQAPIYIMNRVLRL